MYNNIISFLLLEKVIWYLKQQKFTTQATTGNFIDEKFCLETKNISVSASQPISEMNYQK